MRCKKGKVKSKKSTIQVLPLLRIRKERSPTWFCWSFFFYVILLVYSLFCWIGVGTYTSKIQYKIGMRMK